MTEREEIAAAFGNTLDPLEKFNATFEQQDIDPFAAIEENRYAAITDGRIEESTAASYDTDLNQYRRYMRDTDRHPACPNVDYVHGWVSWLRDEQDASDGTVASKLRFMQRVYEEWRKDPAFPHGDPDANDEGTIAYNPFERVKSNLDLDTEVNEQSTRSRHTHEEIQDAIADVDHIRGKLIVALQLKLGLRAGEVRNLQLRDINLKPNAVTDHYDEIGTHERVANYQNAVLIDSTRTDNKSKVHRVLPLDEELRGLLIDYLLIRPDTGSPYLVLGRNTGKQLGNSNLVNRIWDNQVSIDVSSHYARHFFSTYWKIKKDLPREYVNYMRGDKIAYRNNDDSLSAYLHAYYEDIEPIYRKHIYLLHL